jgi:hypothetical protein
MMLMKNTFTIREVMDGTGLTRQRVHQLIKSRDIPVVKENKKRFLLIWDDLLKIADNTSVLNFLKGSLDNERKSLEAAYKDVKESEKAMQFAKAIDYARILVEGHPDINSRDNRRWTQWFEAGSFFNNLMTVRNPAMREVGSAQGGNNECR